MRNAKRESIVIKCLNVHCLMKANTEQVRKAIRRKINTTISEHLNVKDVTTFVCVKLIEADTKLQTF